MSYYTEIWARPGYPTFGRVIDDPPTAYQTFHDGMNLLGDGTMQLPDTYDRFDEILHIDPNSLANCYSGLVRVFDDSDPTTPVFEWLPTSILPTSTKGDPNVDVGGRGIKSVVGYAATEAFDWDGSVDFASRDPDWLYGGDDIITNGGLEDDPLGITNPGFEDGTRDPWWPGAVEGVSADAAVQTVVVDTGTYALGVTPLLPEGGTSTVFSVFGGKAYTVTARVFLDSGTDYQIGCTGPQDIVPTAPAVLVALSAPVYGTGHSYEATKTVVGTGAWQTITVTFTAAPGQRTTQVSIREGETVLVGVEFYVDVVTVSGFGVGVDPWEPTGELLASTSSVFEASTSQALTGLYSLKMTGPTGSGGLQRLTGIRPGVTYTATVGVGYASAASTWALEVRDVQGTLYGQASATVGTGAWSELAVTFTVPDFVPGARGEVTVAVINYSGSTRTVYVDDLVFYQGLQPTTVGGVLGDLYADATTDHAGRVVWEDEANPGTPYLTLDFTDSVDSAGAGWVDAEISIRIWMRMSYLQVMVQFAETYGYEWRIVADDVEAGTWLWQVYNPGTMKTDYTTAASPAIQGGSQDVTRQILKVMPTGTHALVEGEVRLTSRYTETTLETALGRIEAPRLDRKLPNLVATQAAAYADANDFTVNGLAYAYGLVDPQDIPLAAYQIGDLLTVHDPPTVEDSARLVDVEAVITPTRQLVEVQFAPATAAGS